MAFTEVTESSFEQEVVKSTKTVLVDFYADWCAPCKMMVPVLEEIATERPDIKIVKINVDKEPLLAKDFRVGSIPFLAVMKDGVFVDRLVGYRPKEYVLAML